MRDRLLDLRTLAAVEECAPQPARTSPTEARLILKKLRELSVSEHERRGLDDRVYYSAPLHDVVYLVELTHKRAGMICRELGLMTIRRNSGYRVLWNSEQMEILGHFFGLDERES